MKKIIILLGFLLTLIALPVQAANVDDFHFSSFDADYYLSKDSEGISHLRVVENLTAEFPDYKQNKGICRYIPFTNQNGANVTLPDLTRSNIKVTRNGATEPIYSIEKQKNFYNVCTGTEEYVTGTQKYTFEYEFTNVVTEFNNNGKEYQELYWDTNGNGWKQRFDKTTARLHFENPTVWTGESWCYVGVYGEKGTDRCTINKIEDGVEFSTGRLGVGHNMTFDVELLMGSFVVPEPQENYAYVIVLCVLGCICLVWLIYTFLKFAKTRDKANYYKGYFVKPEYQPNKDYSLPEMTEVYIGSKKDVKVAMLLELIVKHKIELVKGEKKQWSIVIKNLEDVSDEYLDLLAILNAGDIPVVNETVQIKTQTATSKLISLKKSMTSKILSDLKKDKLVESNYRYGESGSRSVFSALVQGIITAVSFCLIGLVALSFLEDFLEAGSFGYGHMVGEEYFLKIAGAILVATSLVWAFLNNATQKYLYHTEKGLKASRYMDGAKLYIGMAEAERMKMLQSVKGADVSPEGIVKLYEKLLPYAAVFGLEESWMDEMKKYCEVKEITEPDYLMTRIAIAELSRGLRSTASYASAATTMSSSGGGSSSGFSGGGGGGFSGGGGGGGGGGGR